MYVFKLNSICHIRSVCKSFIIYLEFQKQTDMCMNQNYKPSIPLLII